MSFVLSHWGAEGRCPHVPSVALWAPAASVAILVDAKVDAKIDAGVQPRWCAATLAHQVRAPSVARAGRTPRPLTSPPGLP